MFFFYNDYCPDLLCSSESDRQSSYYPTKFSGTLSLSDVIKYSRLTARAHFILSTRDKQIKMPTNNIQSREVFEDVCVLLYLFGVAHALHVGRSDAGTREGLARVLPVAAEHLTLQVSAQRLNVGAPTGEQT